MTVNETTGNPRCVSWDFTRSGGFSEEGLTIESIANGNIECMSNHLTSFAILVSTQAVSILSSTCYSYAYFYIASA